MLQKDGVNITKDIRAKFPEECKLLENNKQVVFKLVNSVFDGKSKKPRSFGLPTYYATQDDDGNTSEYVYYNNVRKKTINGVVQDEFSPEFIYFSSRGDLIINLGDKQNQNLDLFLYMMRYPRRAKNKYGDGSRRPLFYLEDKNAEAMEKVAAESARAKMMKYLYDEESRLPEEDLRTIAKALRIPNVDNLKLPLIQTSIEDACKNNPHKFIQFKNVGKDVEMRSVLQTATDKGIIKFDSSTKKRGWYLNDTDSDKTAKLTNVRQSDNEMETLMSWLKNHDVDDYYGKIVELVTGKIQINKSPKTELEELQMRLKVLEAENENLKLKQGDNTKSESKPKAKPKGKKEPVEA